MNKIKKQKILIFIVAYNAETTLADVLGRIPRSLEEKYDVHVLISDDSSNDQTFAVAQKHSNSFWCPCLAIRTPNNLGYGGNQKIGYTYAINNNFDVVVLLHGDGQYAPECLPQLLVPFDEEGNLNADVVLGSRMLLKNNALKGGMPYYKFIGNIVLTRLQNFLLNANLSEFHTGYRAYRVAALSKIPFVLNADGFHFDTEILVQFLFSGKKTVELPIPTFYGDEICHVDGINYAFNVVKASLKARLMRIGLFFDPKFDVFSDSNSKYESKLSFNSTHSFVYSEIPERGTILDLGCAEGYISKILAEKKKCMVYCADFDVEKKIDNCTYLHCDLNAELPDVPWDKLDYVLLMDVIEHLYKPEKFISDLSEKLSKNNNVKVIISSANVCFFITRLMMLLGQFNYGKRGILDMTHTRLFTLASLERLLRYQNFIIIKKNTVPPPYPLAIGDNILSRAMLGINGALAKLLPGFFGYQMIYIAQPKPSSKAILQLALNSSEGNDSSHDSL